MKDPWWPGLPPPKSDCSIEPTEDKNLHMRVAEGGLPAVWLPIAALFWLSMGPTFASNAGHFGVGFFPFILWMIIMLPAGMMFSIGAINMVADYSEGKYGERLRVWRIAIWIVAAVAFLVIGVLTFTGAFF